MNPKIIIDDFEFTLIRLDPNSMAGRGLLEVKSVNIKTSEEKFFFCYRSISESGIWRLFYSSTIVVGESFNRIEKGADYMSSSTIHFKLQKFIYEKIKIGEIPIDNITLTPETVNILKNADLSTILYNRTRNIAMKRRSPLFSSILLSSECGQMNYNNMDDITSELNKISTIMETNYKFNSEPIFLFNYTNKISYGTKSGLDKCLFITANIYSIVLKNDSDSSILSNLDFYYMNYSLLSEEKYVLASGESIDFNKLDLFAPLCVTPSGISINQYGVYDKIISIYCYICKIIEYKTQLPLDNDFFEISDNYSFIGELYNDLFPYKKLKDKERYPLIDLHELRTTISLEKTKDIEHEGGAYKIRKYIDKITKTDNLNKIGLYLHKIKKYK